MHRHDLNSGVGRLHGKVGDDEDLSAAGTGVGKHAAADGLNLP